jgi:hypothetical protein
LPLPGIEPRSPGRPARSQTLYCLSYLAPTVRLYLWETVVTPRGFSNTVSISAVPHSHIWTAYSNSHSNTACRNVRRMHYNVHLQCTYTPNKLKLNLILKIRSRVALIRLCMCYNKIVRINQRRTKVLCIQIMKLMAIPSLHFVFFYFLPLAIRMWRLLNVFAGFTIVL